MGEMTSAGYATENGSVGHLEKESSPGQREGKAGNGAAAAWGELDKVDIAVNRLALNDISESIEKAFDDFRAYPGKSMMVGAFFVFSGLFFLIVVYATRKFVMFYPVLFVMALIGPLLAAGFYAIAQRREKGQRVYGRHVLKAISNSLSRGENYAALGFVTIGVFALWMAVAALLYVLFFGANLMSPSELFDRVVGTGTGWVFLMLGNLVGLGFLTALFAISAFSFQLLYEHQLSVAEAIATSVDAVLRNPLPMMVWAAFIALAMLVSLATGFIPLLVVMPILGFTAWHIYRKAINVTPRTDGTTH